MANVNKPREGMVWIPPGEYFYHSSRRWRHNGEAVLFNEGPRYVEMHGFSMDQYEVTNADFRSFLEESDYKPHEPHRFLHHWQGGFPDELADHPVIWVSLEDARAYAEWAGKRLPTDVEWQWAAQSVDGRRWPWGTEFESGHCNSDSPGTTSVDAFLANVSPFGVCDMVGNVWEWIDEVMTDGWHRWCFIRGGSYYLAKGSHWYPEGGAQPVNQHCKFRLMYPGLDRCATIGFRCVHSEGLTVTTWLDVLHKQIVQA